MRDKVPAHVLGTFLFAAFWVVLGVGVFFIAVRGGLGGARASFQSHSFTARRVAGTLFVIVFAVFGVGIPAAILIGNHANANGQVGGLKLDAAQKQGREVFGEHCGVCHTLAAANAIGKVGPNLDTIKPSEALVLHTIENGCLQDPSPSEVAQTCLGNGTMPAGVVQGRQAQQVAAFVARVAGRE